MTKITKLLKVAEAAQALAVSESFVYAAIAEGRLKHYRLGKGQGGNRISGEQLAEFLEKQEQGGGGADDGPLRHIR